MRKRKNGTRKATAEPGDGIEQRVLAVAEQLGRVYGTVQAKSKGWLGRKPVVRKTSPASKGRSGGVVDAPGKKHRKPAPVDPRGMAADSRRSTMRSNRASMKTMKQRGRG
jgi:hypothetical protein